MMKHVSSFALGLGVSGMTRPEKVIGFLDLAAWDPALMFVMGGAMTTYMVALPLITRRERPVLERAFQIPRRRDITPRLVIGSVLFGVGWGLAGYCPGPGIVSVATGTAAPIAFVAAMAIGMLGYLRLDHWLAVRRSADAPLGAAG